MTEEELTEIHYTLVADYFSVEVEDGEDPEDVIQDWENDRQYTLDDFEIVFGGIVKKKELLQKIDEKFNEARKAPPVHFFPQMDHGWDRGMCFALDLIREIIKESRA